ncbi:hypothetical protein JCM19237_5516 [Photobacterium aphoticum]|uniref:Uncharacterized protein n=1 Tax=Photobacterium aphoticum TaxID=754436 RepID=A0A090QK43_9GAMM|nr:hypothetical protein JCM19237_5516 [Photobacterium aphoticum]
MQTVAIFGAASGLGAAMAAYFHAQGVQVIGIARHPDKNLPWRLQVFKR